MVPIVRPVPVRRPGSKVRQEFRFRVMTRARMLKPDVPIGELCRLDERVDATVQISLTIVKLNETKRQLFDVCFVTL